MWKSILAALAISTSAAAADKFNMGEFAVLSGTTVGKATACKLDGPRILRATKASFATINVVGKSKKERADATRLFAGAMGLGEDYIKENGKAHCPSVDLALTVIINLGQ